MVRFFAFQPNGDDDRSMYIYIYIINRLRFLDIPVEVVHK